MQNQHIHVFYKNKHTLVCKPPSLFHEVLKTKYSKQLKGIYISNGIYSI